MTSKCRVFRLSFLTQQLCVLVVLLQFVLSGQGAAQSIVWDFATSVSTGSGGHRLPTGWEVLEAPFSDSDGTWLFVNPSSPGGSGTGALGGGDGELKFNNPNDPPSGAPD